MLKESMIEAFNSPLLKPFRDFLDGILDTINAIVKAWDALTEALGMGSEKANNSVNIDSESARTAMGGPIMASQVVNQQRSNTTNVNNTVSVHSSGPITQESAPGIGNLIASMLGTQSRT